MRSPEKQNDQGQENFSTQEEPSKIPPQYQGMPSEIVEELWQDPVHVDEKKNEAETERRRAAIEEIRKREQEKEQANSIREEIGIPRQDIENSGLPTPEDQRREYKGLQDDDFKKFKLKRGETDTDVFWHEYGNEAAKKLKESGRLEWGKERIYFDIPLENMGKLRDLTIALAKKEKIPVAFKHLDVQKTDQVDLRSDSKTTRFVANFASVEDAKRFYQALQQQEEYKKMKSDRNLDYHGYNIDGVAHYASGFREQREPLKRIVETAQQNPDKTYSYYSADGSRQITINEEQYIDFKERFDEMPDPEEVWNRTDI